MRAGASQRVVARRVGVAVRTVQKWVARAVGRQLDQVDWTDRRHHGHAASNRTSAELEAQVLDARSALRHTSLLGEYGARAIQQALADQSARPPSLRTIGRILARHGALDARRRQRRPPPPPGWHLPRVAGRQDELDCFDLVEDLKLADGPLFDVLTGVSLHGGLPGAWPLATPTTTAILAALKQHWRLQGRPGFAQFDNDTRFQGPHQHRDVVGRVSRLCLRSGITPVFVPPRELGLQNAIEAFNGLFQMKVWRRWRFSSLAAVQAHTARYVTALADRRAARRRAAPTRPSWPAPGAGASPLLVYIRRTNEHGMVSMLGRRWAIDPHWLHRLVRVEIDLTHHEWRAYALRRSAPAEQPLLNQHPYDLRLR